MLFTVATTYAQQKPSFRINAYSSYVFDDKVNSYYSSTAYYNGVVNGGLQWGAGLEYLLRPNQGLELTYLRQNAKAPTTYYDHGAPLDPVKTTDFDLGINYILIGGTRYLQRNPKIEPYFGAQLGMGIISVSNATNGKENTATKLAWGIKGGTNFWFSKTAGIKIQAALHSVTQAVGGGLYFGPGGVSSGVASYSTVLQFSLGGGLVFKLGGK